MKIHSSVLKSFFEHVQPDTGVLVLYWHVQSL